MFDAIDRTIAEYNMLSQKRAVVVGVSGGADSMCLLHFLVSNAEHYGIKVAAAHVNHCLRGAESERDCDFVIEQCEKMGIECCVKYADVAAIAREKGLGLEECGRQVRYDFFNEVVDKFNNKFSGENIYKHAIATAHTASDNAETVLLNITRGCGSEGLCGIPAVRGNVIRPLINITRLQVEQYCADNGVPFITDSSNLSDDYSRNKIRLTVLPELSKINPAVVSAVNRMSAIISRDVSFIKRTAEYEYSRCFDGGGLKIDRLRETDKDILPEVIRYAVDKNLGITAEKKHIDLIEKIIEQNHGAVTPKGNTVVRASDNKLIFEIKTSESLSVPPFERRFVLGDDFCFNGKIYSVSEKFSVTLDKVNKKLLNQLISCDIISRDVVLRNRRGGDFFKPFGRNCTKSLKKLFTEMKIPQEERASKLLLADGSNILWIEGIGISQDAAVNDETGHCIAIKIKQKSVHTN